MAERNSGIGGHQSAAAVTVEWLTPPSLLAALGGPESFDLDPCAPVSRPWPMARQHYTVEDDGLSKPWQGRVWLNPPYSTGIIGKFMSRMVAHGTGTALIFARTETAAFHETVWRAADALLFLEGRLHFHVNKAPEPDHAGDHKWIDWEGSTGKKPIRVCALCGVAEPNGGAPNVLCAYGEMDADILAESKLPGSFVPLRLRSLIFGFAEVGTWAEEVAKVLRTANAPMTLDRLYRALASSPKAKRNNHWREKIRQTLQRGPFAPLGDGAWQLDLEEAR